jgi:mannosidase alpha-like ER degradation enhancer 1
MALIYKVPIGFMQYHQLEAGIDSVFEYMLKAYVSFGKEEYKDMFDQAYKALLLHVRDTSGYLYRNVHMSTGSLMFYWIDSLPDYK